MGIETLALASIGSSIIGGGLSAGGALMAGNATANAANYRAQVADNMATYSIAKGSREAQDSLLKTGQMVGKQFAAQGASGLDAASGSAVQVRASTAQLGQLDALTIMNNAAMKAAGLRTEAQLDRFSAKNAKTESYLKAGGSLINTVSSVSDKWFKFDQAGALPSLGSFGGV